MRVKDGTRTIENILVCTVFPVAGKQNYYMSQKLLFECGAYCEEPKGMLEAKEMPMYRNYSNLFIDFV